MADHAALILAAGKGARMHSHKPKVLQTLLGEPMLGYVLHSLRPIFGRNIWTVIGHQAEMVRAAFAGEDMRFVLQDEQLGTGHALMRALPALEDAGCEHVLVINGDTPLITTRLLQSFLREAKGADVAFATINLQNPGAYGRVVRHNGRVAAIVEAKDYDVALYGPEANEVNAGLYCLRVASARRLVPRLGRNNKSGEYYITDLVGLAVEERLEVRGVECGDDPNLFGVNSPLELSRVEALLRMLLVQESLEAGAVIHAPELVRIGPYAVVEPGAELFGPCEIYGKSRIERGAVVHACCLLRDAVVEAGAEIHGFSHVREARVGRNATVGPYGRLRPGAVLEESAHVGNFVEIKKSILGKGAKANHLAYLGDAEIGEEANVGAGTITCNYDGANKFRTVIGKKAFIGSNVSLVAPVTVGDGALVGAGSVITKNVPEGEMGLARARQTNLRRRKK